MELRVLKYFLIVAREENITKAAKLLHITQPTLSRQLMELEEELGVKLFHRGKHSISLTEDGMLLRRRAQELVTLSEKTRMEFQNKQDIPAGEISIGCGETRSMALLCNMMKTFHEIYPAVHFSIYSATADDIKERLEKGLLDMGLLVEPVDISKYDFIHLPAKESWGVLVRNDSDMAKKESVTARDLYDLPLIMAHREQVKNELANWFGDYYDQIETVASYNLIVNAAFMVEQGLGVALCVNLGTVFENLKFVPLSPKMETGSVLVFKKNQTVSTAQSYFVKHIRNAVQAL